MASIQGVRQMSYQAHEPAWALARASVPMQGLRRDEVASIDLRDPYIRRMIAAGYLVPLPAAEQPMLEHDPEANAPQRVREGSDA